MAKELIATLSIGGKGGNYIKKGDEKDTDLEVKLPPLKTVRAAKEFKVSRPSPGYLIRYLTGNRGPRVIMPDGSVVKESGESGCGYEFNDEVAKIFARENDGIFFPKKFIDENFNINFHDFTKALKRCIANMDRKGSNFEEILEKKDTALKDIKQEAMYLDKVRIMKNERTLADAKYHEGLEGFIHTRKKGEEHDTYFGPKDHRYNILLGLDLNGFGYGHLKVCGRRLSTTFNLLGDLEKDSDEIHAISRYVHNQPRDKEKYLFEVKAKEYEEIGGIEELTIKMTSPAFWYQNNEEMKYPVMQTEDMIPIFTPIADKVAIAIEKAKKYKENQTQKAYDSCTKRMGLEVKEEKK